MTQEYKDARMEIVNTRYIARRTIVDYNNARRKLRSLERSQRKRQDSGTTLPALNVQIEEMRQGVDYLEYAIAMLGALLVDALDAWQAAGATLKDLCNLCNRSYTQTAKDMERLATRPEDRDLVDAVFVHHLDHMPTKRMYVEWEDDAPLTHCTREYFLYLLEHSEEMQHTVRQDIGEYFPDLASKMFTPVTDEAGNVRFFDQDGYELTIQ